MEKLKGVKYFQLGEEFCYVGDSAGTRMSLSGADIDKNFNFLRGYDIEGIVKKDNRLYLKRLSDQEEMIDITDLAGIDITLDEKNGSLVIDLPTGEQKVIEGIATFRTGTRVVTDATLDGFGTIDNPLRIAGAERTGTLAAVDEYWDITSGDTITLTDEVAKDNDFKKGYRIVTKENASDFGRLYTWGEVETIKGILGDASSAWRVPTKDDWDSLLNYVENDVEFDDYDCDNPNIHPCGDEGEHSRNELNVTLGESAGKYLKGDKLWNSGVDKYGFAVEPLGFIPDDHGTDVTDSLGKTAVFWCDKQADLHNEMYVKRFEDELDAVKQEGFGPDNRVSLRLVKDANGSNCNHCEYIDALKCSIPTVYINDKIWTSWNLGYSADGLGVRPEAWNGLGEETKEVFIVNEWNGESWTKRQLIDGDSIIVRHYIDPEDADHVLDYHEFRIVKKDGEFKFMDLVDVLQSEIQEELDYIIETVREAKEIANQTASDLADEVSARTITDANLASEIDRAKNKEDEIAGDLQDLSDKLDEKVNELNGRCDENAEAVINAVTSLTDVNGRIDELNEKVDTEVEKLGDKIADEVSARTEACADLQEQIDANKVIIVKNEHPEDDNVLCEYQLFYEKSHQPVQLDSDGKIRIPNDRFIKDVKISTMIAELNPDGTINENPEHPDPHYSANDPALVFSFVLQDGSYKLEKFNLTGYLLEEEFSDGLSVDNHIVKVKVADVDEGFLGVSRDGIYTEGIADAIEDKATEVTGALNTRIDNVQTALTESITSVQTGLTQTINAKEAVLQAQIDDLNDEVVALKSRVSALEASLADVFETDEFKAAVTKRVFDLLQGTANQIALTWKDAHNQELVVPEGAEKVQISFAPNTYFIADV